MGLSAGSKLGPYEILAPLGAGGMGEVYRARDTRLDRTVALKVLAAHLSSSPDLKQRFDREAKAISSLNHPHICTLYDVGQHEGADFLVMEYLEGQSLAQRLERGPLPLEQVLQIGMQIADALDKAHRQGFVHRDLKPGNVMLTKAGAKLLDFGLAKPLAMAAGAGSPAFSAVPAVTSPSPHLPPLTTQGAIVGTFGYMAPEQIEGAEADARSDVFAFGAVLYEMLSGKRAFAGKTSAATIAAILEREPVPLAQLQPGLPPDMERLVKSCLAKDPDQRRQTARDVLLDLQWMAEARTRPAPAAGPAKRSLSFLGAWVAIAAAIILITTAGTWMLSRPSAQPARIMRFEIPVPSGYSLGGSWYWFPSIALSPDGKQIAYVAHQAGVSQLYVRAMDDPAPRPIPGSEGAHTPFYSPDGRWLGAFIDTNLVKFPTAGGPPITLAHLTSELYGACWAPDDTIYFGVEAPDGLLKIAAAGGKPTPATTLDPKNQETDHRLPSMLPGGKALLFVIRHGDEPSFDEADIAALNLKSGIRKIILKAGTDPRFVAPGYLVFIRAGVLMGVPFDPDRLEVKGEPAPILENVLENPRIGAGQFSIADTGSMVFIPGGISYGEHELVLVDKNTGAVRSLTAKMRPYEDFTISPDGRFIATTVEGAVTDTWIHDIARDTDSRFTFGVEHRDPAWTPDSKRIVYDGFRDGKYGLFWKPFDGSGAEEQLVASENPIYPWFWSPDGRRLIYAEISPATRDDIWMYSRDDGKARPLFQTPFSDEWASWSPDGRWIAYNTDESGRSEVYVVPFPALAPRVRISTEGGRHPLWAPNGRELYYRTGASMAAMVERTLAAGTQVMAVPITTSPTFQAGAPRKLFAGPYFNSGHDYAVTPDGKGFVLIRERVSQSGPAEMRFVLNWTEDLKRRIPAGSPGR